MERKITIEEKGIYQEDYQMRMLQENKIEGLLPVRGRGVDEKSYFDYEVSGKVSVKSIYEKNNIDNKEIKKFLSALSNTINDVERYLLNIHCLLLKPEYIFYDDGNYYFCYYPPGGSNLWEEFHTLTEYLVKKADYKDQECVRIVFLLHKKTMEENYSLEKLITECVGEIDERLSDDGDAEGFEKQIPEEDYIEEQTERYDYGEHDWITEQEMGSSILKETDNMWTPVKRFLTRHKKPKWGDWDGLYIEEEEL